MRDIQGYEGLYGITSCGRVWSYRSQKFLKPKMNNGYLRVELQKDGTRKSYYVHRLVADAYIPNPDHKPQVNHKDEDKTHSYTNNLEWMTAKENINYGTRTQRSSKARSKAVYCVELDKTFDSMNEAKRQTNIDNGSISSCCRGKRNTAGGYHWSYCNA